MSIKNSEILRVLSDSINSLEEMYANATLLPDSEGIGNRDDDLDSLLDEADDLEGAEAALMIAESRIEEITQVLGEEIENLRTLMEKIEEKDD